MLVVARADAADVAVRPRAIVEHLDVVEEARGLQYRYVLGYAGDINDRGKIVGLAFGGRAFVATLPGCAASGP